MITNPKNIKLITKSILITLFLVGFFIFDFHSVQAELPRVWQFYDSSGDRSNLYIPNIRGNFPLNPSDWTIFDEDHRYWFFDTPLSYKVTGSSESLRDKVIEPVPDGYGLTGLGFSSNDDGCNINLQTAPVDGQGVVNFNNTRTSIFECMKRENNKEAKTLNFDDSEHRRLIEALGLLGIVNNINYFYSLDMEVLEIEEAIRDKYGPDALNDISVLDKRVKVYAHEIIGGDDTPDPRISYDSVNYPNYIITGWNWGADTGGFGEGNGGNKECYYQQYASLININSRFEWGKRYGGTCDNRYPNRSSLLPLSFRTSSDQKQTSTMDGQRKYYILRSVEDGVGLPRVASAPENEVIIGISVFSLKDDADVRILMAEKRYAPPAPSCLIDSYQNPDSNFPTSINSSSGSAPADSIVNFKVNPSEGDKANNDPYQWKVNTNDAKDRFNNVLEPNEFIGVTDNPIAVTNNGKNFSAIFTEPGSKTVTVQSQDGKTDSCSVTVTQPPPTIGSFGVSTYDYLRKTEGTPPGPDVYEIPLDFEEADSTPPLAHFHLVWDSSHTDYCRASGNWSGNKPIDNPADDDPSGLGEELAFPRITQPYSFTLTCGQEGEGDQPDITTSKTINIKVIEIPICRDFEADPDRIIPPQYSTLSWECRYVDTRGCDITNNQNTDTQHIDQPQAYSGSLDVRPSKTTTFDLACHGRDGDNDPYQTLVQVGFIPILREIIPWTMDL